MPDINPDIPLKAKEAVGIMSDGFANYVIIGFDGRALFYHASDIFSAYGMREAVQRELTDQIDSASGRADG